MFKVNEKDIRTTRSDAFILFFYYFSYNNNNLQFK